MSLPKFIVGSLLAIAIVLVWSLADGAGIGTILLRLVVSVVGYAIFILALVAMRPGNTPRKKEAKETVSGPTISHGKQRPSSH
jgi:hypothetical protein